MGLGSSSFKDAHILHYMKPYDNKLFVYLCNQDKFYSFSIFNKGQKFKFFAQESISLSSGSIYIIGGQTAINGAEYNFSNGQTNSSSLQTTNFVAKINLKKQKNFHIDISDMKPCRVLPEPRSSQLMIYSEPYIFVIGGYLENHTPTRTCRRFHREKRIWENISDISLTVSLTEPCGIAMKNFIYVFDTAVKSDLPRIYQYSIEVDSWMEILLHHKNRNVSIPQSFNCAVYQTAENELMIFSGVNPQDSLKGFYYTYNTETEEISEIIVNENCGHWKKEKQGDQNYVNSDLVHLKLGDRLVKSFRKSDKKLLELELLTENSIPGGFGCYSRNK